MSTDSLAMATPVTAFMTRIIDEHRHPTTGEVFVRALADAAANAFDLYEEDGTPSKALLEVAARVVALAGARR